MWTRATLLEIQAMNSLLDSPIRPAPVWRGRELKPMEPKFERVL